jgi:hypothetical protein
MDLQRELAEVRHFGDPAVLRLPGLRSCTFTAEGDYDATVDAALFAAWNGSTAVSAVFRPDGVVTYTVNVFVASYSLRPASNGMTRVTVNLSSTGNVARA